MFDAIVLARGFALGFAIAATFGPIGLLCLRRSLVGGFRIGLVSGLGAAVADAMYAALAAFGLATLANFLVAEAATIRLVGGTFLIYLGARTVVARASTASASAPVPAGGLAASFAITLALTLSNPMTILSFVGIFAGLGTFEQPVALVVGVLIGSATWWLILASVASRLRTRLTPRVFRGVNLVSGAVIVGFGVQAVVLAFST
jgi:threonine/homoserine/homoserine lactone efflux protein